MLPSSYTGPTGFPGKQGVGLWRGRNSKAKSFSLLLVPETGSEVLSTEEVRSKQPPTSPQPTVERKAPAQEAEVPGLGKEKAGVGVGRRHYQHHLAEKRVSCLGHNKIQRAQTPGGERKATEVKLRNPAFQVHGITSAVLAPDASPAPQPPPPGWTRPDYSLLQYMSFLCSLYHRCNPMAV